MDVCLQNFHPAVISLVTAAAELAERHLRVQMAIRDERLRARYMGHLAGLRGGRGVADADRAGAGHRGRGVAGPGRRAARIRHRPAR